MPEDGDQGTTLVVDTHIDFPESDRFARVMVRDVPESEAYPDGVKYSMHYGNYDGRTILRYDNSHGSTKGHERHSPDGTEEIEFRGWQNLLERFSNEVMKYERYYDN